MFFEIIHKINSAVRGMMIETNKKNTQIYFFSFLCSSNFPCKREIKTTNPQSIPQQKLTKNNKTFHISCLPHFSWVSLSPSSKRYYNFILILYGWSRQHSWVCCCCFCIFIYFDYTIIFVNSSLFYFWDMQVTYVCVCLSHPTSRTLDSFPQQPCWSSAEWR